MLPLIVLPLKTPAIKVHFLEILETLENLEILKDPQSVENKGDSDHFLESREFRDLEDSRDSSSEKTPFVMTPFSGPDFRFLKTVPTVPVSGFGSWATLQNLSGLFVLRFLGDRDQ